MFRRRNSRQDEASEQEPVELGDETDELGEANVDAAAEVAPAAPPAVDPDRGPWDDADAPDDDVPRLDLGALRVPQRDGLEVQVQVQDNVPIQLLVTDGESVLQLTAFAAPRSRGIWDEVRAELAASLKQAGGRSEEQTGPYGTELTAMVPGGSPGQLAPARFIGIDRPRWFLRALLSGPAATDPAAAEQFEQVLAGTVVVRGDQAMPLRDPLPLRLPPEALSAAGMPTPDGADQQEPPEPLGPGPTITETR